MAKIQETPMCGEGAETPTSGGARSKIETVLTMLEAEHGATLEDLVGATGWQPHTARAVLSGLKKKGHTVKREKVDGVSRYRIVQAVDQ